MVNDPKVLADGMVSFLGGQDSGRKPTLLAEHQCFELWNCTVRGGSVKTRPGWDRITLTYQTEEVEEWFTNHIVQGCIVFVSRNGQVRQVWSVGGRFFSIDILNSGYVQEITPTLNTATTANFSVPNVGDSVVITVEESESLPPIREGYPLFVNGMEYLVDEVNGPSITIININDTPAASITSGATVTYLDVNASDLGICYMIQAEDFLIAQDGFSKPFIFDGGSSRRAEPANKEVPVGTVMAYGIGRLWVAVDNGYGFVASDIVYGPSGTADYDKRDAILKFTENTFLNGGGKFTAPGIITAMQFISSLDTSTGQGPLMVFTEEAICSVNAPASRDAWAVVTNPIQTISLLANGATSFYGTIPTTNGDLFYRANDGLRSFYVARREFGSWGNTPISNEMRNVMVDDDPELMKFNSAIVFDNRLLFTVSPRPNLNGCYWKGLGVIDFDTMSTMFDKSNPVYDGTWTGVDVQWVYQGKYGRTQRAFMSVRNEDGENELWEISKKHQFDNGDGRILWKIISRAFSFGTPLELCRLDNLELFINQVVGDVDITVRHKSDEYPCWFNWTEQAVCANYRRCDAWENCETPINFRAGYRTRIGFGQPPENIEPSDEKPARLGYSHQVSVQVEGYCEIKMMRLKAEISEELPNPQVALTETCQEINCCPDDNWEWRSADATTPGGESS